MLNGASMGATSRTEARGKGTWVQIVLLRSRKGYVWTTCKHLLSLDHQREVSAFGFAAAGKTVMNSVITSSESEKRPSASKSVRHISGQPRLDSAAIPNLTNARFPGTELWYIEFLL